MEVFVAIIIGLAVIGVGLAIFERRKGIVIVDETVPGQQTEADREMMRANDVLRGKGFDGPPGY